MKPKTIAEFQNALRAAIVDKRLEQTRRLRFYFDSEVVIRTILGFRQFTDSRRRSTDLSDDPMVLRALLSSGYLGRVYLLLPHALELDYFVRSHEDVLSEARQDLLKAEVEHFLEQYQISEKFSRLLDAVDPARGGRGFQDVIEAIKVFDVSSFVAVELANGHLMQRLISLRKAGILGFERRDQSFESVMRTAKVDEYTEIIGRRIASVQRKHSVYNDAFALAQLKEKLDISAKPGSQEALVRFYTEADVLTHALMESSRLRDDLLYCGPDGIGGIVRSASYFLLRTYFRAIGFPHLRALMHESVSPISIDDLDELCCELESLPEERKIEQWNAQTNVKNERLMEPLQQLESLAFFQGVWLSYKLPKALATFVEGLRDMAVFFREGRFSGEVLARISAEMSGLRDELSRNTHELRELFELFERLEPKISELRRSWNYPLPTGMRDIGLVRWGFVDNTIVEEGLSSRLRSLLKGKESLWRAACREFVDDIRDTRGDREHAVIVCALLWFLEEYEEIGKFISRLEGAKREGLELEFHLMRVAARLRSADLSRDEKSRNIEDLRQHISGLPDEIAMRYYLGFAYILAHAAKFEETLFEMRPDADVAREWLRESFAVGRNIVETTRNEQSMLHAFAVNHCAYVGTVVHDATVVDKAIAKQCMMELAAMEASQQAFWNYRFVDTVLMPRYLDAANTVKYLREEGDRLSLDAVRGETEKIQTLVKEALALYDRSPADREITVHRRRWKTLEEDARDVMRRRLEATVPPLGGGLI